MCIQHTRYTPRGRWRRTRADAAAVHWGRRGGTWEDRGRWPLRKHAGGVMAMLPELGHRWHGSTLHWIGIGSESYPSHLQVYKKLLLAYIKVTPDTTAQSIAEFVPSMLLPRCFRCSLCPNRKSSRRRYVGSRGTTLVLLDPT